MPVTAFSQPIHSPVWETRGLLDSSAYGENSGGSSGKSDGGYVNPIAGWLSRPEPGDFVKRKAPEEEIAARRAQQRAKLDRGLKYMFEGDWFFKWSFNLDDKPHRRWVWLDRKGWKLYWAKSDQHDRFFSSFIPLQETAYIETDQILQSVPGKQSQQVFHAIIISTVECRVMFSTPSKSKFDLWLSTICTLTRRYRRGRAQRIALSGQKDVLQPSNVYD
eukprot:TRINITY_DN19649_c0_g1_i1.p1 TRINITY_DN19649_c0_g1~~TRINITY_DN19649_c0_g1_i1.p1  ORF type:complete len:219 (+),score=30.03 TRINITY_DN19649_c0_g1_i1:171-827(+)